MSDWTDKPSELGKLFDEARGDAASPERLEAVRLRLEGDLGPAFGAAALAPSSRTPAVPPFSPTTVLVGLGGAVVIAVALWLLANPGASPSPSASPSTSPSTSPSPSPSTSPSTSTSTSTSTSPSPSPSPSPSIAPPPSRPLPRPTVVSPEPPSPAVDLDPGSTLREEIALIDRAIAARDQGDPVGARTALETHRTRFPDGTLRPERDRLLGELSSAPVAPVAPEPAEPDPLSAP